jgi:hypothetical protein
MFEFVEKREEVGCPAVRRNWLAVKLGDEGAEWFDRNLKARAEAVIKVA